MQQNHLYIQVNSTKELLLIFLKLFQKTEKEEMTPKSFYEPTATLIPKSDKDTSKMENYRPLSLKNTNVKILNKILANQI